MTILGGDLSEEQPITFPWAKAVAAGWRFVYLRASIGYRADGNYFAHRQRARAAGLLTGSYHAILRHNPPNDSDTHPPMQFDPAQQARAFASVVEPGDELPPVVDVEAADVDDAELWAFIGALPVLGPGTTVAWPSLMIYTSQNAWYARIGRGKVRYARFRLWCAEYDNSLLPDIWPRPTIKQTAGTGHIDGYAGELDLDEFEGDEAAFAVFTGKEAPVLIPNHIKLGPHHMQGGNTTGAWLQLRPAVAKFVGDLGASVEVQAGTLAFGRLVDDGLLDGQGFDVNRYIAQGADPVERAAAYIRLLRPFIDSNPNIVIWEGPNEQILESDDKAEAADPAVKAQYDANRQRFMLWYGDFAYAFAAGLHSLGRRAGIGSWASGQPRPEHNLWQYWTRALQATVDFGAVECRHDYAGFDVTGLLRCVYDNAEFERLGFVGVPQVISELGADVHGTGWRQLFHNDIGACYAQLIKPWLDQIAHRPWFLGAAWYTDGGRGWENYDVSNTDIVAHLATYVAPPEDTMPITRAQQAQYLANLDTAKADLDGAGAAIVATRAAIAALVPDGAPAPMYQARVLMDLALRDSSGNPTTDPVLAPTGSPAGVVKSGTIVPVYKDGVSYTFNGQLYANRAVVTLDGKNVWGVATALQRV